MALSVKLAELPRFLGIFPKVRPDEAALLSDAWLPAEPAALAVPPDARLDTIALLDGGRLLSESATHEPLLWDLAKPWALPVRTPEPETGCDRRTELKGPPRLLLWKPGDDEPQQIVRLAAHDAERLALIDERGRVSFLEAGRLIVGPPSGPPCCVTVAEFSGDGERLAVGDERGGVSLWFRRGDSPAHRTPDRRPRWTPVHLGHGRGATSRVLSLAFDPAGRRLAVSRRSLTEPPRSYLDVYRVRIEDLEELARGHAGRKLVPGELPPEVWRDLFGQEPERYGRPGGPSPGGGPSHPDERRPTQAYLEALG